MKSELTKRLQIATLGLYANERIDHAVLKRGTDKIVVIYTEKNKDEVDDIRERYTGYGIPFDAKRVEPWNYDGVLSTLLEVVLAHPEYDVEFNISCGTRVMTSAAHMAALFTDTPVVFVIEVDSNVIGHIVEVQPISMSLLTPQKRIILQRIVDMGGIVESQRELGSCVEFGVSSISKHVKKLERAGYVQRYRRGRTKTIEITELGRVMLRLKQVRKGRVWKGD